MKRALAAGVMCAGVFTSGCAQPTPAYEVIRLEPETRTALDTMAQTCVAAAIAENKSVRVDMNFFHSKVGVTVNVPAEHGTAYYLENPMIVPPQEDLDRDTIITAMQTGHLVLVNWSNSTTGIGASIRRDAYGNPEGLVVAKGLAEQIDSTEQFIANTCPAALK